jgi:hypothetical protein
MKRIQIEKTDDTAALNRPVGGGIVFLMILEMGGWGGGGEEGKSGCTDFMLICEGNLSVYQICLSEEAKQGKS